ncbi:hypothetical protein GQ600_24246 [Phytophthora cactorum]|nr:hypothetical protein GQ600_24246 [Phytophthora cactorum]
MLIAFSGSGSSAGCSQRPCPRSKTTASKRNFLLVGHTSFVQIANGRAAMTTAQRTLPYQQLAERLHQIPWGDVKKE